MKGQGKRIKKKGYCNPLKTDFQNRLSYRIQGQGVRCKGLECVGEVKDEAIRKMIEEVIREAIFHKTIAKE